jgi:hypothetical protein
VRLELLCLAAKMRSPVGGGEGGGVDDGLALVLERCERAVRDSLCEENCLAVLLLLKPCAAELAGLIDAAHAVLTEHVSKVVEQPIWVKFARRCPEAALSIMQGVALKQASRLVALT